MPVVIIRDYGRRPFHKAVVRNLLRRGLLFAFTVVLKNESEAQALKNSMAWD